jgi:hypothetical protein
MSIQETIVDAAVRVMAVGKNHAECLRKITGAIRQQGFLTNEGRFVDRYEALDIATSAGQLKGRHKHNPLDQLMSEDLWGREVTP